MNSDLTQAQNPGATDNPQTTNQALGASDAAQFQQSAGMEALTENRSIQVVSTGPPNTSSVEGGGMSTPAIIFIIVSSVVLLMIASSVFRWIMKRPEPVKPEAKPEEAKLPIEFIRPQGKKKLPRSKRHK